MDPNSENYYSWSPYAYVANNPMLLIDPDGKDWYSSEDGSAVIWKEGNTDFISHTYGEGDDAQTLEMKNIGSNYYQYLSDGSLVGWDQNQISNIREPQFIDQKKKSFIESISNSNNFFVKLVYNMANDYFIVGQKFTFGYFDKTNEYTGGMAATNLDGSTNYHQEESVLNVIGSLSGAITNKGARTLGASIPEGLGYIKPKEGFWGASIINLGIGLINGNVSRAGSVKMIKGLEKKEDK